LSLVMAAAGIFEDVEMSIGETDNGAKSDLRRAEVIILCFRSSFLLFLTVSKSSNESWEDNALVLEDTGEPIVSKLF
ncbi:unnamed protein product, partial [Rotaria magnacalcarata]